jgi:hypothetical protein
MTALVSASAGDGEKESSPSGSQQDLFKQVRYCLWFRVQGLGFRV